MADIKFHCPECTQRIGVAESAAGVKIDCPTCHSRLVIPRSPIAPVEVLIKRRLAIVGGSADAVYAELQKAEVQAEKAADEIKRLGAESTAAALNAGQQIEELTAARKNLETEVNALRPLREQITKAQQELAAANSKQGGLAAAQAEIAKLRKEVLSQQGEREKVAQAAAETSALREQLAKAQEKLAAAAQQEAEFATLRTTHDETQERLSGITAQFGALQSERDTLAQAAAEAPALREQLAAAQRDAAHARSSAETMAEAHRAQLDAAKGLESGVRAELAAVQTRHTQAEGRLAEGAAKFTALEAEHSRLAAFVEELVPLREQLAKAQADLCQTCESAAEKARGYEAQLEAAKISETELRTGRGEWQSKHAAAQKQIAEQTARLADLEKRATEFQAQASAAKSQDANFAGAQSELKRALAQAAQYAKERDEAAGKIEEILASADASEKAFRAHSSALKAKLEDAERRHAAVSHGFTALKQERVDLTAEINALRKERDEAAANAADKLKEIEKLLPVLEKTKSELARLREEANAAAVEKGRIFATLEKTSADHAQLLERCKQLDAAAAAGGKEIARLKQLVESANAGAKGESAKAQELTALTANLTALVAAKEAATSEALAQAERHRKEHLAAQDRAQKAERTAAETAERLQKNEAEKTALTAELSKKAAEFEALKNEAAQARAALEKMKSPPKNTRADSAPPTEKEKALEAERDALAAALDRAKQHVGVLQARRDMLRDEVATLRSRLGLGGLVSSGDEKPIAK